MSWYKIAKPIEMKPNGMDYNQVGHNEESYLYVIDRGKFVFIKTDKQNNQYHENIPDWKYIQFNTQGRVDLKNRSASIFQHSFEENEELLKRKEKKIAIDGIHKNFGNDIKIYEF
jgi:hypothetical protein